MPSYKVKRIKILYICRERIILKKNVDLLKMKFLVNDGYNLIIFGFMLYVYRFALKNIALDSQNSTMK